MNHLKTLLILLLTLPQFSQAQEGKVEFGIEGGPSFTNLRGPQEQFKYNGVPLYAVGITYQYHFSSLISLKTGLSYDPKEFTASVQQKLPFNDLVLQHDFSQHFDYLTLPIMIRLQFGKKVKFFANAGGYLGVLLADKRRVERNGSIYGEASYYSKLFKSNYSAFDFGASAGLGIGIPIKKRWTISLEARGNLGLAKIHGTSGLYGNRGAASTYSSSLLLGASYWLNTSERNSFKKSGERNLLTQNNRFEVGLEGGPNIAPFLESRHYRYSDGKGHTTIHSKLSYSGGISFQWNSRKYLALKTGLMYQNIYHSFANDSPGKYNSGTHRIEFLTLPLMARVTFGQKVHFFLNAGLFVSAAIRQIETIDKPSNKIPNFNPINFGAAGGLGMGIPMGKRIELSLEIRNNMGLTNSLTKSPNTNYNQTIRINTLNALLGISYKFGFRETEK